MDDLYALINEDDIDTFWRVYNVLLAPNPAMLMQHDWSPEEVEESIEHAWQLLSQKPTEMALQGAYDALSDDVIESFIKTLRRDKNLDPLSCLQRLLHL